MSPENLKATYIEAYRTEEYRQNLKAPNSVLELAKKQIKAQQKRKLVAEVEKIQEESESNFGTV